MHRPSMLNLRSMNKRVLPVVCLLLATEFSVSGQDKGGVTDATIPVYEVVSVKPNKSGDGRSMWRITPSGFSATNTTLPMLVAQAYEVDHNQVSGLTGWAKNERFDLVAKVGEADVKRLEGLTHEQRGSMLQAALRDRFRLAAHRETTMQPVFELVVTKGGPKLKEASPSDVPALNGKAMPGGMWRFGPHQLTGQAMTLSVMAQMLRQVAQRPVIDKTGLTGKYDVELNFGSSPQEEAAADDTRPSLFTALEEQLGLKLQPAKAPVEMVVVDHVEEPAEN
jgi:uncharacterized protein (TIGR03435 family)